MDKKVIITLSEPLETMAGQTISELTADFSKVRAKDVATISRLERKLKGGSEDIDVGSFSKAASPEWRAAFTWIAVLKATKGVCYDDIDNLSIIDFMELSSISLPFAAKISI
jgi:hypothetical protein